jgi:hypothetical protein
LLKSGKASEVRKVVQSGSIPINLGPDFASLSDMPREDQQTIRNDLIRAITYPIIYGERLIYYPRRQKAIKYCDLLIPVDRSSRQKSSK